MNSIYAIIKNKPPVFLLITLVYLLAVGLLKWQFAPPPGSVWFLIGGALGVYFLDAAEVFFHLTPSPFRSIVFMMLFLVVSFFVVTSSGSFIATGLVLSLFLTLLLWQAGEWQMVKNLNSWYRMIAGSVPVNVQQWILVGCAVIFSIESYLFIR